MHIEVRNRVRVKISVSLIVKISVSFSLQVPMLIRSQNLHTGSCFCSAEYSLVAHRYHNV